MNKPLDFPCQDSLLAAQLNAYVQSHAAQARTILDLPDTLRLAVELDEGIGQVACGQSADGASVRMNKGDALKVMAYSHSFQWANGVVIIPTLTKLVESGAFLGLAPGATRAMLAFAMTHKDDPEKNLGTLWGAFNLLALQGWVKVDGGDRDMRYALTDNGVCAVALVERHLATFQRLSAAAGVLQHCHALCHRRLINPEAVATYVALVAESESGWGLGEGGSAAEQRVRSQLVTAMDGYLAGPTWIALDMPVFEQKNNKRTIVARSIFGSVGNERAWIGIKQNGANTDATFLAAAWRLLHRLGQVEFNTAGSSVRLSERGHAYRPIAAPFAALPASYLRSYARLQDLLFGEPDPLGVDQDTHLDRIMNIYGSSGAGSGPASREISEKIIHRIFNETPLAQQPAGLADMGCGDGSALKRLADYVINHTARGRNLAAYPLLVLGADYNESARSRARETLSALEQVSGVEVRVVHADISHPAKYDEAVRETGLRVRNADGSTRSARLRDFLHTFMFLVHNRRLQVRDGAEAERVLQAHLEQADPALLAGVAQEFYGAALPEGPLTVAALKDAFRVAYSDEHGIVPGYVAAADLVDFMGRWKPFIKHGFLAVEGHSPWAGNLIEEAPQDAQAWMKVEKLPHPFNWGMHFLSRQFMMPYNEYRLALALAGFAPSGAVHGRIHPEGFPGLDTMTPYRFFSIADYVPVGA
jgi:hypothetical protein